MSLKNMKKKALFHGVAEKPLGDNSEAESYITTNKKKTIDYRPFCCRSIITASSQLLSCNRAIIM